MKLYIFRNHSLKIFATNTDIVWIGKKSIQISQATDFWDLSYFTDELIINNKTIKKGKVENGNTHSKEEI